MRIKVTFQEKQGFFASFCEKTEKLGVTFGEVRIKYTGDIEDYAGPYEVVPKVRSQVLKTKEKRMEHNVFVYEIPYATVSNQSGGMTATIGGE